MRKYRQDKLFTGARSNVGKETIYRDYVNGHREYWMYSDGERHFVARPWAEEQVNRGRCVYVDTDSVKRAQ
jgi:hypothetical protein